jgi:hypothetical protein
MAKAKDNQGKLTQQALLVLQGACKVVPSDRDEKGGLRGAESYQPELTWWTIEPVRSCHLLRVFTTIPLRGTPI